jgi:uncharacterized protein (DUF983 family)
MTVNQKIGMGILAAIGILSLVSLMSVYLIVASAWREFRRAAAERDPDGSVVAGSTLTWYALRRRCPRCGQGKLESSFLRMNSSCPACGLPFWKNEGEWLGPVVINYGVAFAAALGVWAMLVIFDSSATLQVVLSCTAAAVAAIAVTPWSQSFWTLFLYLTGELGAEQQS